MLPKGPACTSAGPPSAVCTRLGRSASRSIAVIAPAAPTSAAVTGAPRGRRRPRRCAPRRASRSSWLEGERDDGHHLARGGDVEAVLPRHAVGAAAEAEDHVAQGAVVHVERAAPGDRARVERALVAEREPEVAGVVDHRREQVVRGGDGVDVAGEVQVDVVRGDQRGAARRRSPPPLTPKTGPSEGSRRQSTARLPRRRIPIASADRGGRLALAGGRRVDRRHEDEPARAGGPWRGRRTGERARARSWPCRGPRRPRARRGGRARGRRRGSAAASKVEGVIARSAVA